jgi:CRP/FNR family transcriptional regulator, cyclic AMP receptor protein
VAANDDVIALLGSVQLFEGLKPRDLRHIAESGRVVSFTPGHEVTTDGASGVSFHLVLDGGADVEVHGQHRATLSRGSSFGEISMIDGGPRTATVRVNDQGLTTFALSSWEFNGILEENPSIARDLLKVLCARIRAAEAAAAG